VGAEYGPDAVRYKEVFERGVIFSGLVERRLFILQFPQVFLWCQGDGIVLAHTIFGCVPKRRWIGPPRLRPFQPSLAIEILGSALFTKDD
jgi:hypothetical protein